MIGFTLGFLIVISTHASEIGTVIYKKQQNLENKI